ncbi:unnamed protein product [Somion occarium]|uniref:MYND-type domain-containing protein n=1 Tax=Somion occarium TaxID=3059160 RepID=A0ABP1DZC5_9APHY
MPLTSDSFEFTKNLVMHRPPGVKRSHHTWHSPTTGRSHFEDFMLEIGADPRVAHVCCVPRPDVMSAYHASKESKANSIAIHKGDDIQSRHQEYHHKRPSSKPEVRRLSSQAPTNTALNSGAAARMLTRLSVASKPKSSQSSVPELKSHTTLSLDTQSFPSSRPSLLAVTSARDRLHAIAGQEEIVRRPSYHDCMLSEGLRPVENNSHHRPSNAPLYSSSTSRTSSSSMAMRNSRPPSFTSIDTASSSEGPATPRANSPIRSLGREREVSLESLERTSRLRTPTSCVTCKKSGSNFPSCPKCGDMWCSRQCRIKACKGGRHSSTCRGRVANVFSQDA